METDFAIWNFETESGCQFFKSSYLVRKCLKFCNLGFFKKLLKIIKLELIKFLLTHLGAIW